MTRSAAVPEDLEHASPTTSLFHTSLISCCFHVLQCAFSIHFSTLISGKRRVSANHHENNAVDTIDDVTNGVVHVIDGVMIPSWVSNNTLAVSRWCQRLCCTSLVVLADPMELSLPRES
jgi:hypothetical protein